jgi:serine phosphatase RsbU (regulator of sigma subunit)
MSLRLRLIVAFFFLAVVPLAAVTAYTYTSNVEAMRDAASQGAELLAGELTQRMEIVTAQLGQRVERLMNMTAANEAPIAPAATPARAAAAETPAAPAAPATTAVPAAASGATTALAKAAAATAALGNRQTADTFDLAMLINNVEISDRRGRGGRRGFGGDPNAPFPRGGFGPPPGSPPTPAPGQAPPAGSAPTAPATGPATPSGAGVPSTAATVGVPTTGATAQDASRGTPGGDRFGGQRFRGGDPSRGGPPPDGSGRGITSPDGSQPPPRFPPGTPRLGPPDVPAEDPNADPSRIRIDMAPIRDEVLRQIVPDGRLDQLSAEERARVFAEVQQRMLGIRQGIEMLQTKVAERAAEVKAQDGSAAKPGAAAAPAAPTAPGAAPAAKPRPPTPPVVPAAPKPPEAAKAAPTAASASQAPSSAPTQRRTAITGSRLDVSVEQNGEVVGQANAEINLPNLLSTVFTTTQRDRGEVPFAVGKDGRLYTPTEADKLKIERLATKAARPETPPGIEVLPEWVVVTTADPSGSGLKFGIARPVGDALADLQRTTARNAGLGLGFIALMLVGIVPLSSRLTRDLSSLSDGVRRIAQGEYHARVEARSNDEVGQLARAFNQMAADVEAHQRSMVGQERIRRELELGRQIQHDMLPQVPLVLGLTEIKGVSVPAREVGGDFFNYFQLTNGTIALLVGDVSGKGVGAALLMANIQASLRTRLALGQDLAALARELDRDIEGSTPGPVYATLFVGIFDPVTRVLRCVNAGHNPQYVLRQDGGLERMESTGLPIGLLSGRGYTEQRVQLTQGDLLFFYTDGCVEAEDIHGAMFGPERLEQALVAAANSSADAVLAAVEADITRFRDGVDLSDDATMMAVKVG